MMNKVENFGSQASVSINRNEKPRLVRVGVKRYPRNSLRVLFKLPEGLDFKMILHN